MGAAAKCGLAFIQISLGAYLLLGFLLLRNCAMQGAPGKVDGELFLYSSWRKFVNSRVNYQQRPEKEASAALSQWGFWLSKLDRSSSLCEFRTDMADLSQTVLQQKLVECFKKLMEKARPQSELVDDYSTVDARRGDGYRVSYRRLLEEIASANEEIGKTETFDLGDGTAPFYADYSGPQTHPPKNN